MPGPAEVSDSALLLQWSIPLLAPLEFAPSGLRWERLWFRTVSVDVPGRVSLLQKSLAWAWSHRVLWLRPTPLEVLDWTYDYTHRGLRLQPNFSAVALLYLLGVSYLTLLIIS